MKFRPCIDLHQGVVKQIVGSTLTDDANPSLGTNFSSSTPASAFAEMYASDRLKGGHVIMLGGNPENTAAAESALAAYPNSLQLGGGITDQNARKWLEAGASQVIVTSYIFSEGKIDFGKLDKLVTAVGGPSKIVLDLSCRKKPDNDTSTYYVVTDRWQTYTDTPVNSETLTLLSSYCSEFLVHGVENEGKRCGILDDLVILLGEGSPIPVTYAGGVSCMGDLDRVKELGKGRVDLTIGSALDIFGGELKYQDVINWHKEENS